MRNPATHAWSMPSIRHADSVPPHVVYITNAHAFGGAEEYLVGLARNVRAAGWQVSVVLPARPYLAGVHARLREADVRVVSAEVKTQSDYPVPMLVHLADVRQRRVLRQVLGSLQPDIVHVNQPYPESAQLAIEAATSLADTPVVTTVHLYESVHTRGHRLALVRDAVTDRHFAALDAITTPSPTASTELARQYRGARGKVAGVVPHALDLHRFDPDHAAPAAAGMRQRLTGASETPLVGVIGRLVAQKRQRALLEVWPRVLAAVPAARLVVAGDGPDQPELARCAQEMGIADSVTFLGHVPSEEVPGLLGALDVLALPSLHECMPIALVEALAMARPVVATRVNAVPDVLEHDVTGLLVPPGDGEALARATIDLLEDRARGRRLGEAGRAFVRQRFSAESQVEAVLGIYDRLLAHAGR